MSPTATATLLVTLGFAAVVVGVAVLSVAVALIVAGSGLVALGFLVDEPRRAKAGAKR